MESESGGNRRRAAPKDPALRLAPKSPPAEICAQEYFGGTAGLHVQESLRFWYVNMLAIMYSPEHGHILEIGG